MPVYQVHRYFYIHNRMPSAVFDIIEEVERSTDYIINESTTGVTFYSASKLADSDLRIAFIKHWYPQN